VVVQVRKVMTSSFSVRNDQRVDSLKFGSNSFGITRTANINYLDNWESQPNLVLGSPFKVQIVAVGNLISFSWNTIQIVANSNGIVDTLVFSERVPVDLLPHLGGNPGEGQNFPIYIGDSNGYIIWVDTDGTVTITTEGFTGEIVSADTSAWLWGSTISWTTNTN
jgi:hypothetical protein